MPTIKFRDDVERAGWFQVYAAQMQAQCGEGYVSCPPLDIENSAIAWADSAVEAHRVRLPTPSLASPELTVPKGWTLEASGDDDEQKRQTLAVALGFANHVTWDEMIRRAMDLSLHYEAGDPVPPLLKRDPSNDDHWSLPEGYAWYSDGTRIVCPENFDVWVSRDGKVQGEPDGMDAEALAVMLDRWRARKRDWAYTNAEAPSYDFSKHEGPLARIAEDGESTDVGNVSAFKDPSNVSAAEFLAVMQADPEHGWRWSEGEDSKPAVFVGSEPAQSEATIVENAPTDSGEREELQYFRKLKPGTLCRVGDREELYAFKHVSAAGLVVLSSKKEDLCTVPENVQVLDKSLRSVEQLRAGIKRIADEIDSTTVGMSDGEIVDALRGLLDDE